jgi:hydroxypyruvate reductase
MGNLALEKSDTETSLAYIFGGETVVKLHGGGLGGRNQETALAASIKISGKKNIAIFSVGSDGTDGPTDAAGGYVDGESFDKMLEAGVDPALYLDNNDSYHALAKCGGLIFTGPTGTNVNDVAVILIRALK